MASERFSIRARLRSFRYAWAGLRHMYVHEHNARIHLAAVLLVCLAGWRAGLSAAEWRWIGLAIILVWMAEAVNSAIEQLCDVVSPGPDPAIARAKDIAAGAVLISACGAVGIGASIFWPHFAALF